MDIKQQIEILNFTQNENINLPDFNLLLKNNGFNNVKPKSLDIFQVNMGRLCNQACKHCHVNAGIDSKEAMSRQTMQQCLDVLEKIDASTVDITGGAPEMNPNFRWFVEECKKRKKHVMVRCNLSVLSYKEAYKHLPAFYAKHQVEVIGSLPFYTGYKTDRMRGKGSFGQSIKGLQMLNKEGYGKDNTGLVINLVYNPSGAFLPGSQKEIEKEFKDALYKEHGIVFNNLFTITNMPISRFLEFLINSENLIPYMEKLVESFNPAAVPEMMCRSTISVSWDGYLYDCDFNQMLDLKVDSPGHQHISAFDEHALQNRNITFLQHCYGCTAGSGSSCGGATVEKG
jgi:radical SAM/Cys-rich protein